ncbi:E3 ubiquitin-protein ligase CHFR-like isoform X2 [Mya arenaria]|uniref:E3 ubiquitin-protein ligase CHFR-like isoform X2 n=1 Tax=Mya arenaria TaxID=6604 RepID=UPI0022E98088|nr:E3 ubiquitin-protein ligase CHFR-like isoform X2 [Mya arenaria]
MDDDDNWCQLVSLTDFESEPYVSKEKMFRIGRSLDNDISLPENKLVSGHHCYIERDESIGKVILHDTSTNGTLLNMVHKLTKGKSKELAHGDEIYLVYKKDNMDLNVGYMYQDMAELRRAEISEESTQEYNAPDLLDATLEDSDCNHLSTEKINKKRSLDYENDIEESSKRWKPEKHGKDEKKPSDLLSKPSAFGDHDTKLVEKDASKTVTSLATPRTIATTSGTTTAAIEQLAATTTVSSAAEGSQAATPRGGPSKAGTVEAPVKDDIEENLLCIICQEIMQDCISLQPCLHSYCAGCYSDWMARSQECPSCRKKVERINKNHIVNNLIEAYLKEHPAKRRPDEDIAELNKKNKITTDMLYPKTIVPNDSSEYSDSDEDDGEQRSVSPAFIGHLPPPVFPPQQPVLFGFGTPLFGVNRAFKTVCRQCPEYKDPDEKTGILGGIKNGDRLPEGGTSGEERIADQPGTSTGDGESRSKDDIKDLPTPPNHKCGPNQNHVLCQCCLHPMPDFRVNWPLPGEKRPQQCGICYRAYCHAYWGCRRQDCLGCINTFREMNFGKKCLHGLILENQVESDIFKEYLEVKGLSVRDVVQECCQKLDAGVFTVPAQGTHRFTADMPVCYACGLNNFRQLAFQYRKAISKEDLPEAYRNRQDCYWGSKCRTQKNKPHHAKNFNHVCDQIRQF